MHAIFFLLVTCDAYAVEDTALKRQAALSVLNAIGNFEEIHGQFINLIKGQFDLYLRNHADMAPTASDTYAALSGNACRIFAWWTIHRCHNMNGASSGTEASS